MAVASKGKRLVTMSGRRPEDIYPVPSAEVFEQEESEFLGLGLDTIGEGLRAAFGKRFGHLADCQFEYRWKRSGGKQGGNPRMGTCQKPSGLLKHFSGCDFIIWLAADHCRDEHMTNYQIEALMFHELCHASADEDGKPTLLGHDIEAFKAEVEEYGLWERDLVDFGHAVQLRLLDEDD